MPWVRSRSNARKIACAQGGEEVGKQRQRAGERGVRVGWAGARRGARAGRGRCSPPHDLVGCLRSIDGGGSPQKRWSRRRPHHGESDPDPRRLLSHRGGPAGGVIARALEANHQHRRRGHPPHGLVAQHVELPAVQHLVDGPRRTCCTRRGRTGRATACCCCGRPAPSAAPVRRRPTGSPS